MTEETELSKYNRPMSSLKKKNLRAAEAAADVAVVWLIIDAKESLLLFLTISITPVAT